MTETCPRCEGKGKTTYFNHKRDVIVYFLPKKEEVKCFICGGSGEITKEYSKELAQIQKEFFKSTMPKGTVYPGDE